MSAQGGKQIFLSINLSQSRCHARPWGDSHTLHDCEDTPRIYLAMQKGLLPGFSVARQPTGVCRVPKSSANRHGVCLKHTATGQGYCRQKAGRWLVRGMAPFHEHSRAPTTGFQVGAGWAIGWSECRLGSSLGPGTSTGRLERGRVTEGQGIADSGNMYNGKGLSFNWRKEPPEDTYVSDMGAGSPRMLPVQKGESKKDNG